MIINEDQLFDFLRETKQGLLVEPPYPRKYPPLGLCKISGFIRKNGGMADYVRQVVRPGFFDVEYDHVFITTLFTYNSGIVLDAIREARKYYSAERIIVGGIYASLMPKHLAENTDVLIFPGYSRKLDAVVPDFSLNRYLEKPWSNYSYVFTTRGCPNKCAYCGVWRMESPNIWVNRDWKKAVVDCLPNVLLSDNNLTASPMKHIREVTGYLMDKRKKVLIDSGIDCKRVTPEIAKEFGKLLYSDRVGLRIAFDRIEEDGIFQRAVEMLAKHTAKSHILAFVLFNFMDTPQEAQYRMLECKKLGIRFYPELYKPLDILKQRPGYVGKYWTPRLVRAFRYAWLPRTRMKKGVETYMETECNLKEEDWEAWNYKR